MRRQRAAEREVRRIETAQGELDERQAEEEAVGDFSQWLAGQRIA